MRTRLCIQPVVHSSRMPASTIGKPVQAPLSRPPGPPAIATPGEVHQAWVEAFPVHVAGSGTADGG